MNNASRMRIICDPFKKEIDYQWYDFNIEDYVEFDPENSKLASNEFVNATIQNRAYEIVGLINRECNVGNVGLEIVFIGTEDDYNDLCDVIKAYYGDANIECVRDTSYFNSAKTVMPLIKEKFSEIKTTLEEYTEEEIAKLVDKYNDAVKPSISLCMMGLYSAGKSAFINSIIGAEVLPSASDPTTAKVCKIYCDKKYQIRFWFDDKECVLTFNGSKYKPSSNFEKEIVKKLQSIVDTAEQRDEIFHMNRALDILNTYTNNEHKISDIIEIRLPFKGTLLPAEEFDFIIYDTPGSNSDNNVRHFEVLKDSLDEQTNALPIFLTTPDSMDAEDNDKILELIEETGASLDTTNAIVIVNKADEKGPKTLKEKREKCQNLRITKWKSTRIFFLSSVLAIASKKNNPDNASEWLDEDMYEIYEKNESKYSSDERKLYEFNIIDRSKADDIVGYSDSKKTTHLYKNSGLESIEKEIIEYAQKYASYNKCQQASTYLQDAIDLCVDNVADVKKVLEGALKDAREQFDDKKRILCDQLEKRKDDVKSYNNEFQKAMEKDFNAFVTQEHIQNKPESRAQLENKLQEQWKKLKEQEKKNKKDKSWALSQIQQFANEMYNDYLKSFSEMANKDITSFWGDKSKLFKDNCSKIVQDSDALTPEQKDILDSIVLSKEKMFTSQIKFDLREIGAIRKKHFLFIPLKSEKFDAKLCCDQMIVKFNDAVRARISGVVKSNNCNFSEWTNNLIDTLTKELCKFNSDLNSYEIKIEDIGRDIQSKTECKKMLSESKDYIDTLLNIQIGEVNG